MKDDKKRRRRGEKKGNGREEIKTVNLNTEPKHECMYNPGSIKH